MTKPASRREFLKLAAALSATRFAPPLALNLAALGESAAATDTGLQGAGLRVHDRRQ